MPSRCEYTWFPCQLALVTWFQLLIEFGSGRMSPASAAAKSLQSCPTLCNPRDSSPQAPPVPGILQARTLKWVAISFSNAWKWKVKVKSLSRVQMFMTPWTAAYQAPLSMRFPRQEYWSGVPVPSLRPVSSNHFNVNILLICWLHKTWITIILVL